MTKERRERVTVTFECDPNNVTVLMGVFDVLQGCDGEELSIQSHNSLPDDIQYFFEMLEDHVGEWDPGEERDMLDRLLVALDEWRDEWTGREETLEALVGESPLDWLNTIDKALCALSAFAPDKYGVEETDAHVHLQTFIQEHTPPSEEPTEIEQETGGAV